MSFLLFQEAYFMFGEYNSPAGLILLMFTVAKNCVTMPQAESVPKQLVKLHNAVAFQMLHCIIKSDKKIKKIATFGHVALTFFSVDIMKILDFQKKKNLLHF